MMSETPSGDKDAKWKSWFEPRTIEEETSNDLISAVCFKYFSILIGALFAIVLAKPDTVSGTLIWGFGQLRFIVYWYSLIGFFGLLVYEGLIMFAKNTKSQLKIPFILISLFGLYVTFGFYLFITVFGRLLGVDN